MKKWALRWFVALDVFAGMVMGLGLGIAYAETFSAWSGKAGTVMFFTGLALYLIIGATLGRGYLQLIRGMK